MLSPAEGKTRKPVVKKGAGVISVKGVARSWKDINKTPLNQRKGVRRLRPVLNFERGLPIVKKTVAADGAVQRSFSADSAELTRSLKIADPLMNFEGLDFVNWGAGWPPDTTGDVGIDYYVQAVNISIGVYDKSDGSQLSAVTFDDFFEGPEVAGTPCDENNNGDPMVLYDPYEQRWFLLDFAWDPSETDGSWYSIAVSQTSNPLGDWWLYAMRADDVLMNDYPKCGVWHDGIYITANMFQFTGGFQGVKVWALNKADLYSGTLNAQYVYDTSYLAWSILPANAKGVTPPAAGTPNYMIAMDADEFGPPYTDKLCVWEYDVDWSNPGNTTWTGPVLLPVNAFGLTASGVPQLGTGNMLDSLFGRLMFPAIYREFDGHAAMYVNHVCEYNNRRTIRWYEVRFDSGGTPSIYQQGTYAPDNHHRWMASMAADEDGNIAIGYSVSSSTMHPAIRYTGRASINPTLGVLALGEGTIIDGTGSQTWPTRWGDYTSTSIDPVDDQTFWHTNEYLQTNGTHWYTRIASFKLKPDLWSQDRPDDTGEEPNTTSTHMWQSNDIWVRNQNDGFTNHTHQNPEYGQTNYLYVMIRNREGEGSGIDKVYWAFPGTGLSWPDSWEFIDEQPTGTLEEGDTTILEFPWDPPDPGAYGSPHFCLLSRIITNPDPPYGMTFPEGSSINTNTRNNNNIVWKNITIVDNFPNGGGSGSSIISVENPEERETEIRLEFVAAPLRTATELTDTARDILDWGTVRVDLGEKLFSKWQATDSKGTGVTVDKNSTTAVTVQDSKAHIESIRLKPGEKHLIKFEFTPFEDSLQDKNQYTMDVIQYNFDGKRYNEVGGVRFIIKRKPTITAIEDSRDK
jgi:hypothetical protein